MYKVRLQFISKFSLSKSYILISFDIPYVYSRLHSKPCVYIPQNYFITQATGFDQTASSSGCHLHLFTSILYNSTYTEVRIIWSIFPLQ
jgi:hypothetical protein